MFNVTHIIFTPHEREIIMIIIRICQQYQHNHYQSKGAGKPFWLIGCTRPTNPCFRINIIVINIINITVNIIINSSIIININNIISVVTIIVQRCKYL